MPDPKVTYRNPWAWVSSLYLAEGLPYVVVMTVAVIMYKGLGISNTDIALYTSWLYLPWVIKPLWSPIVDILKTRRAWIWVMQLIIGGGLAGVALTLPTSRAFQYSLAFLWLLAFSSATQDIAIDGFYLLATTQKEQSFFVGIRTTFYRISTIFGQGLLVILAGIIQDHSGLPKLDLQVAAKPETALVQSVSTESFPSTALAGELRIMAEPATVEISPNARTESEVRPLLALVKNNNLNHGFYAAERKTTPSDSWWIRHITNPVGSFFHWLFTPFGIFASHLESFLREHFADPFGANAKVQTGVAGNIGIVSLHLSKPPGREVVVSLGSKVGFGLRSGDDKSFSVAEGTRFIFNDQNWNQPAMAVIQLDPKLKQPPRPRWKFAPATFPCPGQSPSHCSPECFWSLASTTSSSCLIPSSTSRAPAIPRAAL